MDSIVNKRPALLFYPADWLKDPDLQICSMNTIGIWINVMCRMWEAKEEGVLQGKPGELALLVGARPGEFKRFINEAVTHLFADVTKSNGVVTIKCRRMNRLFLEREGGKMRMRKHRDVQCDANVTTPLTSSSTSSSSKKDIECKKHFEIFWKKYPRKQSKVLAQKSWMKLCPEAELLGKIYLAVEEQKEGEQWRDPKFIPLPATWLNQERWNDELIKSVVQSTTKTKLFPIGGKICSRPDCGLPAVYKDSSGSYDNFYCVKCMPEKVKELYA